jgi:hypothetical protein
MASVVHPGHHRQRHVEGHRENDELGVLVPRGIEAGAEHQDVDLPEGHTEHDHPEHHRGRHLEQVAEEGPRSCDRHPP